MDEGIDAIYIATPAYLHLEQTIAAAGAGKHVLCEKPMALNAEDCDAMMSACAWHHVTLGIAYYRHFYPAIQRIKEILASGEIGTPTVIEIQAFEWFERKPGEPRSWLLDQAAAGGGPMMDFGCHRIELLQHLFGKVKDVHSQTFNVHFNNREVEDTAYVSLLFDNHLMRLSE